MNYLIIGTGLSGNLGSQAMVHSTYNYLLENDSEATFSLLSFNAEKDREIAEKLGINIKFFPISLLSWIVKSIIAYLFYLFGLKFVSKKILGKLYKHYLQNDYVLEVTGISFNDHQGYKTAVKHFAWVIPSIIGGFDNRYIKLSQAVGPLKTIVNKTLAKIAFNRINCFKARGVKSLNNVLELSHKFKYRNYSYAPDLSFLLNPAKKNIALKVLTDENIDYNENIKYFAFLPNLVQLEMIGEEGLKKLYSEMAKTLDYIIEQGYELVMMPHSFKRTSSSAAIEKKVFNLSKMVMDDSIFIRAVYEKLENKDKTHLVLKERLAYETKGVLQLMNFNIVMRFHSMIGSLGACTPCFVVSWSHKYLEVMKEFELDKYVIDGADYLFERYSDLISEFINNNKENNELVAKNLIRIKELAEKNFEEIKANT